MAKKRRLKKTSKRFIIVIIGAILTFVILEVASYCIKLTKELKPIEIHKEKYYYAYDFGFLDKKSEYDQNTNGIDDYTDILIGLKKFAKENPKYVSDYYDGGYPKEGEGVCTDTIWYALKEAGYLLKDMIDYDIEHYNKEAKYNIEIPDPNIDFRRVDNQEIFFDRYLEQYSTDIEDVMEFNPGDILVFNYNEHIAMTSDKRNAKGMPYLIQNRGEEQEEKEEDRLEETEMELTSHYRFTYNEDLKNIIKEIRK